MSFFEEQNPEMDRYLEKHTSEEPDILRRLRRETFQKTTHSHMISGLQQGRLLSIISKILQPKKILEIGTFTGYATLAMCEGLAEGGTITTLDINGDLAYLPRKYFAESKYGSQIHFELRNAIDYLVSCTDTFDLIFVDADKENYFRYYELCKPRLNAGGVLMFDNVLWHGKILEKDPKQMSTQIIQKLNDALAADEELDNLILPLRDGVNLCRKK